MKTMTPLAMRVQLARLFGARSAEAKRTGRTSDQWRASLRGLLGELERYVEANVTTDKLHLTMIVGTIDAARTALDQDDFWPVYAEAMTRLVLLLLGDYPDHRSRAGWLQKSSVGATLTSESGHGLPPAAAWRSSRWAAAAEAESR